jgi:hypothetical protein
MRIFILREAQFVTGGMMAIGPIKPRIAGYPTGTTPGTVPQGMCIFDVYPTGGSLHVFFELLLSFDGFML